MSVDFSGLTFRAITSGFLTSHDWEKEILDDRKLIEEFSDLPLIYAVSFDFLLTMQVIHRKAKELFEQTVDQFQNPGVLLPGKRLAVAGCFADNGGFRKKAGAQLGSDPLDPDVQDYMGIIVDGTDRFGEKRPGRAFLTFKKTPANAYSMGIGDPPVGVDGGFGGLGAVVLGRKKFPTGTPGHEAADEFYRGQARTQQLTGQTFVATSPVLTLRKSFGSVSTFKLVLIVVKPDDVPPGSTLDAIRDQIFDAGFEDAVFLDGSDSVFWNLNGRKRIKQGRGKNRLTSVGLGFVTPAAIVR